MSSFLSLKYPFLISALTYQASSGFGYSGGGILIECRKKLEGIFLS